MGGDPAGTPADVSIVIDRVTYKNAALSLLIGSSNELVSTITVSDEAGRPLGTISHLVMLDLAQGIVGAAIAATQDKATVDRNLVAASVKLMRLQIYGKPGHKPKVPRPPAAASTAAPAAGPAPAIPAPTIPAPAGAKADSGVPTS